MAIAMERATAAACDPHRIGRFAAKRLVQRARIAGVHFPDECDVASIGELHIMELSQYFSARRPEVAIQDAAKVRRVLISRDMPRGSHDFVYFEKRSSVSPLPFY